MSEEQKALRPDAKIVESLINLRDELASNTYATSATLECLYKINSCLYGEYPVNYDKKKK